MIEQKPYVTIGMPVYNGEKYICQALDSLLVQDYEHFELIISDNASTDTTPHICEEYAKKDQRIECVRQKENIGGLNNFQFVLEKAKGEFFMWAAHDDLWEPNFVSSMVKLLQSDSKAVLAFSLFDNIDEFGLQTKQYPEIIKLAEHRGLLRRALANLWFIEPEGKPNLFYGLHRTQVLRDVGGARNYGANGCGSDMLLVFELNLRGAISIGQDLCFHKRHVPEEIQYIFTLEDWNDYHDLYSRVVLESRIPLLAKSLLYVSAQYRGKKYKARPQSLWVAVLLSIANKLRMLFSKLSFLRTEES